MRHGMNMERSLQIHNVDGFKGTTLELKSLTILAGPHRGVPDLLWDVHRALLAEDNELRVTFDPPGSTPSGHTYFDATSTDRLSTIAHNWSVGVEQFAGRRRAWARRFGVPKVCVQTAYSLVYGEKQLPISQVSTGQLVALGVIACLFRRSGGLALVAYPETAQHPVYQVKMALLLADALKVGGQAIVVTHSQYLLLGLKRGFRWRRYDVIVHEFLSPGQVVTHRISDTGIIHGWLKSFAKVDSGLLSDSVRSSSSESESRTSGRFKGVG